MLETILKLYTMFMVTGVTSPVPHLFGPPGCGKSTVVKQAAELIGKNLHTLNVSRLSPLEVEGVQMPVDMESEKRRLHLLLATFWAKLQEGDIVLLDEFLRGFPEVYNALLDIITSREVAGYTLPRVFIIAASNSTVSYDKALEDRLLHLPVPDPRKSKRAKAQLAQMVVDQLGLMPEMKTSLEMQNLLDTEVLPMFDVLDNLKNKSSAPASVKGSSVRNLIGQAQLREVHSAPLRELLSMNNSRALREGKTQYVFIAGRQDIKAIGQAYEVKARGLVGNERLTEIQAQNLSLNLQLLEMEAIRNERGTTDDDDTFITDSPF